MSGVTNADRERLLQELLVAERAVNSGDFSVTYRPVAEIKAALEIVERELGMQTETAQPRIRQVRIFSEKGL
ncbi:MAG: hypothetical protein WAS21_10440 [Geminicoccaceae bacterium]